MESKTPTIQTKVSVEHFTNRMDHTDDRTSAFENKVQASLIQD